MMIKIEWWNVNAWVFFISLKYLRFDNRQIFNVFYELPFFLSSIFSISSNYPESWKLFFSAICTRSILLLLEISAYLPQRCDAPYLTCTLHKSVGWKILSFFLYIFAIRNSYKFNHISSDECRLVIQKKKGCGKKICTWNRSIAVALVCFFFLQT